MVAVGVAFENTYGGMGFSGWVALMRREDRVNRSVASKQSWILGSCLRRETMGSMAQGLRERDGYSGGRAKGFCGDGQGSVDSVLSSCKARGLDG